VGARGHIVLVGLMASGKTTVGELLARRLDRPFLDNDVMLERRTGRTARDIADRQGGDVLHQIEEEVLVDALRATAEPAVIAAAAAAVLGPAAGAALAGSFVVYLRATAVALAERVEVRAQDDDHRPFVAGDALALFQAQMTARDMRFVSLATLVVDATRAPADLVDEISAALARA
jgi:shikimate kinase